MGRPERKALIEKIEQVRSSKVICYVTGDRSPVPAQIGDDAVRQIYTHLRALGHLQKLDVFIYSRGGAIDVPWRIVSAFRKATDNWNVLIPYRANSAATLLALGADQIILGAQGELGPIDPSMAVRRIVPGPGGQGTVIQDNISVEDVMAYVRFVEDRCKLTEQAAIAGALSKLVERVDAVTLGNVYRTHSHIRDVARRILMSRRQPAAEPQLTTIVQTLAEQVYAHGHAIGFSSAHALGLPVEEADADLEPLMWALLEDYEQDLKLLQPLDPAVVTATSDAYSEDACIAVVESAVLCSRFVGQIEVRAKRQMPPTLNVSLNLNVAPPPGSNLPPQQAQLMQQMLQQLQQAILQMAQQAVQQALSQQAPLIGCDAAFRGGVWETSS